MSPGEHDVDFAKIYVTVISQILGRRHKKNFIERIEFKDENGEQVVLPASAMELLKSILVQMAQSNALTLMPIHAESTSQQAADILNVSRPYIMKLLEAGDIHFAKKGTHKHVLLRISKPTKHKLTSRGL